MNAHVKPKVDLQDVGINLLVLSRNTRTLCLLAEQAQKAISAAKRMKMAADFDYYDDLIAEQAHTVNCSVDALLALVRQEVEV